jgi:6-pyruvoyltetrahydropterin/6-carboxytetrahydropterin synthase
MYTITVRTGFDAAHSVETGTEPRERPHRHAWLVEVECAAAEIDRCGLVMDFRVLKRLLEACTADFRDALLDELPDFAASNPTAENVARTVHRRLEARLPGGGPRLVRTTVWEAEGCSATYRPAS